MGTPYLGELRIVAFNFPPKGWAECNGQLLPINQNQALFALLGTRYGGDGRVNFAVPDLRGRTQIHVGSGYNLGQRAGEEFHTLTIAEMPQHVHFAEASTTTGNSQTAAGNVLGAVPGRLYTDPANLTSLHPSTITNVGGSQPHENRQPFLVLNVIIALVGVFPSPN